MNRLKLPVRRTAFAYTMTSTSKPRRVAGTAIKGPSSESFRGPKPQNCVDSGGGSGDGGVVRSEASSEASNTPRPPAGPGAFGGAVAEPAATLGVLGSIEVGKAEAEPAASLGRAVVLVTVGGGAYAASLGCSYVGRNAVFGGWGATTGT